MNATAIRAEIAELRRQGNELVQSDSSLQTNYGRQLLARASKLEASLRIPAVTVPAIDLQACARAAHQIERARVLASVSPRLRDALERIQAGRLTSSLNPNAPAL